MCVCVSVRVCVCVAVEGNGANTRVRDLLDFGENCWCNRENSGLFKCRELQKRLVETRYV